MWNTSLLKDTATVEYDCLLCTAQCDKEEGGHFLTLPISSVVSFVEGHTGDEASPSLSQE